MTKIGELAKRVKRAGASAIDKAETKFYAAQGRKAVDAKVRTAKAVSKKALKTGLIVGALGAAAVIARETKKRRVPG